MIKKEQLEKEIIKNEKKDLEILELIREYKKQHETEESEENKVEENNSEGSAFKLDPPLALLETIGWGFLYQPIKHLFHFEPMRSIEELDLRGCVSMTKQTVHYILEACTSVKDLNLSFLQWIDDETLKFVANKFKETLIIFQVRYWSKITPDGIQYFWEDISGYSRIFKEMTEKGEDTKKLIYHFPTESKVQRLNISDNKQIKNESMKIICKHLWIFSLKINLDMSLLDTILFNT